MKKPVVLVIRDGWGEAEKSPSNAVSLAKTPFIDMFAKKYPNIYLHTDGEYVGLPKGQMGNSEVGHLNIGAGRIVYQSLTMIDKAIADDQVKNNEILLKMIDFVKKNNGNIHILGLLSDGGVHSHINHIIEIAKVLQTNLEPKKVFFHAFLDGRDVAPQSAKVYIEQLVKVNVQIASISGRYYAMDRDKKWDRELLAYDVIVSRKGNSFKNYFDYIDSQYSKEIIDEFIIPAYNENIDGQVKNNDVVFFANFRPDRARQLTHLFIGSKIYDYVPTFKKLEGIYFTSMMKYEGFTNDVLFNTLLMKNLLADVLYEHKLKLLKAAETEKYPHVTFFLDGGKDIQRTNEVRILVNSPKVATYDLQPEMSARELTTKILEQINDVDVAVINYANPDMVGHTGVIPAVIIAVEVVDEMIGKLYKRVVEELGGILLVFADHGNAEKMIADDGVTPHTSHTTNLVKLYVTTNDYVFKQKFIDSPIAKLADLAPTMVFLLGINKPSEMTGEELLEKN